MIAKSGADWPTLSPTGGGDEMRYAVARGSTVAGRPAVLPSGVVTATSRITATMIAVMASASWRPLNGPTRPWRSLRWLNSGRSVTQMAVLNVK